MLIRAVLLLMLSVSLTASTDQPKRIRFATGDCSEATVTKLIAAVPDGGTITCPAGTWEWTNVAIGNTKGFTLQGAGVGNTIITTAAGTGTLYRALQVRIGAANSLMRITGFTFDVTGNPGGNFRGPIHITGTGVSKFRFDHNAVIGVEGYAIMLTGSTILNGNGDGFSDGSELTGVIDNNTFQCPPEEVDLNCTVIAVFGGPSGNNGTDTTGKDLATNVAAGWGEAYARAYLPGSEHATYIEDNTFDMNGDAHNGVHDLYGAVEIVWRNNTHDAASFGMHGVDSSGYRGPHHLEMYRNNVPANTDANLLHYRSRTPFFWDNIQAGSGSLTISGAVYRARPETFQVWLGQCDGTATLIDVNTGSGSNAGYPCADQQGWLFDEDMGNATWTPDYFWGNRWNGAAAGFSGEIISDPQQADTVQCNREYYKENASFDGAATINNCTTGGVGIGTLAARPATCTTGVAYWATDQGSWNTESASVHAGHGSNHTEGADGLLYKCTATDTWTLYYTPYAYPHPLRGGA